MFQRLGDLRRHIVGRMTLLVVLPTVIIFLVVLTLVNRRNFVYLNQLSEDRLESFAEYVAAMVEDQNNNAVLCAQRMAEAQVAGMFGMRRESIDFAEAVLRHTPGITAAYFCYEPNADGKDAASLETVRKEAMDAKGRFLPYWFINVSKGRGIELEPTVDMEESLYYQGVKEAFERSGKVAPMVTEPYVYQGKMIVEQTYPIVIGGEFKGIAGVDRALADVAADLRRLAAQEGLDLFLISSRGKFIATTTDPLRESMSNTQGLLTTQRVLDTPYASLFDRLTRAEKKPVLEIADDPLEEGTFYYVAATVPTGDWIVVARQPRRAILSAIWEQLRVGVGMALALLGLFLLLLLRMAWNLSRRINRAVEAADRVARGDLTEEIDPGECPDETGKLLSALKTMMDNLNTLVGNVRQASIRLHSTSTQLAATGHQQEAATRAFGASTTEIAAALQEISATGAELVRTMDEVNQVATGTAQLATDGHESLQTMESNMRGLDEATGSIAEKLATINEKASNITGVVTTITKVADQTNLLSVNAAIEAEKAGEYGVGFLVVAREIRRLADQTAGATLDIEQMVSQMQSAVSAGVMEMDRFTDLVRRSVRDVGAISQQMSQIIERVKANTGSFERVNESMQSQAQGANQISDAMQQLTASAKQTSDALKEYSQAADDLQEAIGFLKASVASFQLKAR